MMGDELNDMEIALARRTFFLNLSPMDGQEIAESMGFFPPSEDVGKEEVIDAASKWSVLSVSGILDWVHQCSEWFAELLIKRNPSFKESDKNNLQVIFYGFGVSVVSLLLDQGLIKMTSDLSVYVIENEQEILDLLAADPDAVEDILTRFLEGLGKEDTDE
jgi:hypothetical protein